MIYVPALIAAVIVAVLWFRARHAKDHPPYDGSVVIGSLPPIEPPVIRNERGQFVKGSKPLAPRGPGGRFIRAA